MRAKYSLGDITPPRIASAKVEPRLFARLLERLADQHGDGCGEPDPYFAAFMVFVEDRGIEPGSGERTIESLDDHLLMQAMTSRFFALVDLAKSGHLRHWKTAEDGAGLSYLHPSLSYAACKSTLLFDGEKAQFQPLEFLSLALQHAPENEPILR